MTNAAQRTILLAEDDRVLRETLARRLTDEGYTVFTVEDGQKGLDHARNHQPDLILLDIKMPQMTGYEMLKTLREEGSWGAEVPVVFLTNITPSSDDEVDDIQALKPTDYIVKGDTSLDDFVTKVRAYLKD